MNAMAYCKMSILRLGMEAEAEGKGKGKGKGKEVGLVAVPALTKDELVSGATVARLNC